MKRTAHAAIALLTTPIVVLGFLMGLVWAIFQTGVEAGGDLWDWFLKERP